MMLCDELETEMWLDYSGEPMPCYPAKDADAAIAELKQKLHDAEMAKDDAEAANTEYREDIRKLKAENEDIDYQRKQLSRLCAFKENEIKELKDKIQDLKVIISQKEDAINKAVDIAFNIKKERDFTKRSMWLARAAAAEFWANYWFDVAPSESIKYDRIGRMKGVEKECVLTKVTKHMTASDWVGLWEKVERLCRHKAEEYK